MNENSCIFCKIVKKEIPAKIVYEDEKCLAFLDINPLALGHTLVVPKKHAKSIFDLDEEDAKHIFSIAKKICLKMKEKLGAEGVNLVQSSEEVAGQSIPHFHLHVIPRKSNDDLSDLVQWWRSKVKKVDEKQLEEIAKTIKLEEEQKEEEKEERSEEEIYWIRRETELA
jgi:histidine triad (HIT) family protein